MSPLAAPLERLVAELTKLPGIGRKTAQRLAFHLVRGSREDAEALASAIGDVKTRIRLCSLCFNLAEEERCPVCLDSRRDRSILCVLEDAADLAAVERTGAYRGLYHLLGGALSPLKDIGPDDLRIRELVERIREGGIREVILATHPDVEGEATAVYLVRLLRPLEVPVSRLAQGLPAGADLEFTDDLTLRRALEGRRSF